MKINDPKNLPSGKLKEALQKQGHIHTFNPENFKREGGKVKREGGKVKAPKINPAEELLWEELTQGRLRGTGTWRREFQFYAERKFRADFHNFKHRLIVEVEGGVWMDKGGHSSGTGILRDMEKYNLAAICGFHVLRFTPDQILKSNHAVNTILEFISKRSP